MSISHYSTHISINAIFHRSDNLFFFIDFEEVNQFDPYVLFVHMNFLAKNSQLLHSISNFHHGCNPI